MKFPLAIFLSILPIYLYNAILIHIRYELKDNFIIVYELWPIMPMDRLKGFDIEFGIAFI